MKTTKKTVRVEGYAYYGNHDVVAHRARVDGGHAYLSARIVMADARDMAGDYYIYYVIDDDDWSAAEPDPDGGIVFTRI